MTAGPGAPGAREGRAPRLPWLADLGLGLRLAVAGGRSGWVRLALVAVGIGVGVSVLLLAASIPSVMDAHGRRATARLFEEGGSPLPGVDPLYVQSTMDAFRGQAIWVAFVEAGGPHPPVPPGLDRVPGPGQIAVSPALARLMHAPDGALLRERYPQQRVATIEDAGLDGPRDLRIYVGASGLPRDGAVYRFGVRGVGAGEPMPAILWALLVVGVVVLLFPVFVFVAVSARLSGAERDRTLAAVRLVGASAAKTRRIAAGESLAGALLGLGLGAAGFVVARPIAQWQSFSGVTPFAADVVPTWPLAAAVVVAVPALAVGTTLLALRTTLIEPLGVTRRSAPVRRRGWWRPIPPLAGVAVLLFMVRQGQLYVNQHPELPLVTGVVLLLTGVPVLLPWVLDRALRRGRGQTPALQLATSRLRLDSGTPARVVAALGVVVAGAIGMSTLLGAAGTSYQPPAASGPPLVTVGLQPSVAGEAPHLVSTLARTPGVTRAATVHRYWVRVGDEPRPLVVAPCAVLAGVAGPISCREGQVFAASSGPDLPVGTRTTITGSDESDGRRVPWTAPAMTPFPDPRLGPFAWSVLATPSAVPDLSRLDGTSVLVATYDAADRDVQDRIRTAVAPLMWQANVGAGSVPEPQGASATYTTIRRGLLAGTLLTLALAAATMLVSAVEQIRERRRPLAALAASGVPRAMLARSLLWQNAIPLVLAVAVADLVGVVLATLLLPLVGRSVALDWGSIAVYSAAAALAAGVATLLALPAVVRATRPSGLRAE